MAVDFGIRDRHTWAWKDDTADGGIVRLDDRFALGLDDPHTFDEYSDGVPYLQRRPVEDDQGNRLVFDPVCNWADDSIEEGIYDWAVSTTRAASGPG